MTPKERRKRFDDFRRKLRSGIYRHVNFTDSEIEAMFNRAEEATKDGATGERMSIDEVFEFAEKLRQAQGIHDFGAYVRATFGSEDFVFDGGGIGGWGRVDPGPGTSTSPPPPKQEPQIRAGLHWTKVLGVVIDDDFDTVKSNYRELANQYHPDREGGSTDKMKIINKAFTEAKRSHTR